MNSASSVRENDVGFEKVDALVPSAFDDQKIDGNLEFWVSVCAPPPLLAGVRTSSFVWILPSPAVPPAWATLARFFRSLAARPRRARGYPGSVWESRPRAWCCG